MKLKVTIRIANLTIFAVLLSLAPPCFASEVEKQDNDIQIVAPKLWKRVPSGARNDMTFVGQRESKKPGDANPNFHIWTETRIDHEDALLRLYQFSQSRKEPVQEVVVDGWPGFERRYRANLPEIVATESDSAPREAMFISIMVAAGDNIIRIEGAVQATDPLAKSRIEEIEAAALSIKWKQHGDIVKARNELVRLREATRKRLPVPPGGPVPLGTNYGVTSYHRSIRPIPVTVGDTGGGELDIAVNGAQTAISTNNGLFTSAGGPFTLTSAPASLAPIFETFGDPSVKIAQSGAFYNGTIVETFDTTASTREALSCSVSVSRAATFPAFTFQSFAKVCPGSGSGVCFTDQPLLAGDRWNASNSGADQVYATWRNFSVSGNCGAGRIGSVAMHIACTSDGGASWVAETSFGGGGDFPRPTVGRDGQVYAVYRDGGSLMVDRFSSCSNGLTESRGFPRLVGDIGPLDCPIPGIDRCDSTTRSSYSIATDDATPGRIIVAYAAKGAKSGTDNIAIAVSLDYGQHWSAGHQMNSDASGRRFFPAICITSGNAFVGWYDRRTATAAHNDLTDYYLGNTMLDGALPDTPVSEINLTEVPDPECDSGWPAPPRSKQDAESCSHQPQLAGVCKKAMTLCSYTDPHGCPSGDSCETGRGWPKYGDYNGIACDAGDIVAAWASATAPGFLAPLPSTNQIEIFSARVQPPTITLAWKALPSSSLPRSATVIIDANDMAAVADIGQTGQIVVAPGTHQILVSGIWGPTNMQTTFAGACNPKGEFDISLGQHLQCSATTQISSNGLCEGSCNTQFGMCLSQPGPIASASDPDASNQHQEQCQSNLAACLAKCKTP